MYIEDFEYEPTLEELYRIYVINNSGEKLGYHHKTNNSRSIKDLSNYSEINLITQESSEYNEIFLQQINDLNNNSNINSSRRSHSNSIKRRNSER